VAEQVRDAGYELLGRRNEQICHGRQEVSVWLIFWPGRDVSFRLRWHSDGCKRQKDSIPLGLLFDLLESRGSLRRGKQIDVEPI
jgi:hypothetical protein